MLGVGVLGDIDDSEELLDLASSVSELAVANILFVVSLGCLVSKLEGHSVAYNTLLASSLRLIL